MTTADGYRFYGLSIRRARRRDGDSQISLARTMGVTSSYISKIESGKITPSVRVAEFLNGRYGVPFRFDKSELGLMRNDAKKQSGQIEFDFPKELLAISDPPALMPAERQIEDGGVPLFEWDISQTISELSYLTHNYYRYYGKFPPTIPRKLIRDYYRRDGSWILDNYSGSGTTLVEAKLQEAPSIGIDLSPLATLAAKVKTTHVDITATRAMFHKVRLDFLKKDEARELDSKPWAGDGMSKWFSADVQDEMHALKRCLLKQPMGASREFLVLAYLAIVRRVSLAFDGEVRPHINAKKKQRGVWESFERKVFNMFERAAAFAQTAREAVPAEAIQGNNLELPSLLQGRAAFSNISLVISHPPYLNCFDYTPVYKLEFHWGRGFPELGSGWTYDDLRRSETRCWPATDESIFNQYFHQLKTAYSNLPLVCRSDVTCCVVLGDCTIHGVVIPVLERLVDLMKAIGFRLHKRIHRTTHYGTGKYAYADRADYHGGEAIKKDGIYIFKLV